MSPAETDAGRAAAPRPAAPRPHGGAPRGPAAAPGRAAADAAVARRAAPRRRREGHAKQTSESSCPVSRWQVFFSVETTLWSRLQGSTQQITDPWVWREQPKDELCSTAARKAKPGSKKTCL